MTTPPAFGPRTGASRMAGPTPGPHAGASPAAVAPAPALPKEPLR